MLLYFYIIGPRRKGKQVKFLPARDWAIVYRNLKPLLRPCGDLGEGRLDFYHRSLSKAVRKKLVKTNFQSCRIKIEVFDKIYFKFVKEWHLIASKYLSLKENLR